MTIKNAKDLSPREWYLFLKVYSKYFSKVFVESNKNRALSKVKLYLCSNGYAEQELRDIKAGYLISYVGFEYSPKKRENIPVGFMSGFETDSGMLNLLHIYAVEPRNPSELLPHIRRLQLLKELYSALALEAKSRGMTKVQTTSDLFAPTLTDDLESLGFDQHDIEGTEINYGRAL